MRLIALKGFSKFPKASGLDPHHMMQFDVPHKILVRVESYPAAEIQPVYFSVPVDSAVFHSSFVIFCLFLLLINRILKSE